MAQDKDFFDNLGEFWEQFGNELRLGVCILLMVAISAVMRSGGSEPAQPPPPQRNPMELVASPNEPLMIEAIKIARASSSENGRWRADKIAQGPRATFKTPGGSITLASSEIEDANSIYWQLKANTAILHGSRSSSSRSTHSGSFSDNLSGNW